MKMLWAVLMGALGLVLTAASLGKTMDEEAQAKPENEPDEIIFDLSHYPPYLLTSFRSPTVPRA